DANKPVYRLRWKQATTTNQNTALLDPDFPNVAFQKVPKKKINLICQTNQFPSKHPVMPCNSGTGLQVNSTNGNSLVVWHGLERDNLPTRHPFFLSLVRQRTSIKHPVAYLTTQKEVSSGSPIEIKIPYPNGELTAYASVDANDAQAYLDNIKNPEKPSNPSPTKHDPPEPEQPKERTAYIDENDPTSIYVLIPAAEVNEGNNCSDPSLRRGSNQNTTQFDRDEPRKKLKSELSGLPFPDTFDVETQWNNPKVSIFNTNLEKPLKELTVITLKDYFVIKCQLHLLKPKRGSEENLGNKLFNMKGCKKERDKFTDFLTKKDMKQQESSENTKDLLKELEMDITQQVTLQKTHLLQGYAPQKPSHRFLNDGITMAKIWSSFIEMEKENLHKIDFAEFEKSCKQHTVNKSLKERLPITDKDKKYAVDDSLYTFTKKCFDHLQDKAKDYDVAKGKIKRLDLDLKIEIEQYEPDNKAITIPLSFKLKF
ncbi:hypothetical protein N9B39_03425, partial [bacterium]|nr:hypothetical protein [bacterium]